MPEWTCPSPDCGEILKGKNARSLSMKRANHERQHQAQDEYVPDILSRARAQGRGIDDLPEHPRPTVDPPETPEQAFPLDLIMGVVSQFSESQKTIQGTQGQIMETLSVMNQNQVALSDRLTKLEEFGNFIMNSAKGAGVPPPDPQPGDDGQALTNLPQGQGGSIVESLIQAYLKNQGSSSGGMEGFVKQLDQVAAVVGAIDRIRGTSPGGGAAMSPKGALDWAKWGHALAKSGAPVPEYPQATIPQPPSLEMEPRPPSS